MEAPPAVGWVPTSTNLEIASARLRCLLPSLYLQQAGWRSELLDRREPFRYDVVVFQKAYDEDAIELACALRAKGKRVVLDLCDNHFYNPDGLPLLRERAERLERMIDAAEVVSVSTEPLQELVPDKETVLVGDVLDEFEPGRPSLRRRLRSVLRDPRLRIVWFGNAGLGSPSSGLSHLPKVFRLLENLDAETPLELTVISNSNAEFQRMFVRTEFPSHYMRWRYKTFPRAFAGHDVCIVPIERNPFTICKSANRVALSLRLGTPVIADSIPSFEEFQEYIVLDDWTGGLRRYAGDPELRERDAAAGREYVDRTWTIERAVREWGALFERALERI